MARRPKPWYRKERKAWFVTINGDRINLGPEKKEAERLFHSLMAQPEKKEILRTDSVLYIFDEFLDWTQHNRAEGTYVWYLQRLTEFSNRIANFRVNDLRPYHVQKWIDTKNSDGHKRGCITAVSRSFNWAVKQGYIDKNPIAHMEKPEAGKRNVVIPEKQYSEILGRCSDEQFHDLITFAYETGARPEECFALEARHVELPTHRIVFSKHEAKGKKRVRIIYLTAEAQRIVSKLKKKYPGEKLFRNADGKPWNRNNVSCRFARMEKHIGLKVCLYNFRHTFATRMLESGVDSMVVAALMGHADLSMLGKVYAHLTQNPKNLLKKLRSA